MQPYTPPKLGEIKMNLVGELSLVHKWVVNVHIYKFDPNRQVAYWVNEYDLSRGFQSEKAAKAYMGRLKRKIALSKV